MSIEIPKYRRVSFTFRFDTVLFPFDAGPFVSAISDEGYIIDEQIAVMPGGARVRINGIVGRKADIAARLEMDRNIVGVHAPDIDTSISELDTFEGIIKKVFGINPPDHARYYEFLTGLNITTTAAPLEQFKKMFEDNPLMTSFSEIIGSEVSPYGLQVGPSGEPPNQVNWFQIRIEPKVEFAEGTYFMNVVWRHAERDKVIAFMQDFDNTAVALIKAIEK